MIEIIAEQLERNERKLWDCVRTLYPETQFYDLMLNWEQKHIQVKNEFNTWEKQCLLEWEDRDEE